MKIMNLYHEDLVLAALVAGFVAGAGVMTLITIFL